MGRHHRARASQNHSSTSPYSVKNGGVSASHPRPLSQLGGWPAVLSTLIARHDLEPEVAEAAITEILEGSATPSQMTAFIVALRAKGETAPELAGMLRAVRAAGQACATNRVAPFVPCHRIVRTDGSLGGYAYGLEVKEALLTHEGAR